MGEALDRLLQMLFNVLLGAGDFVFEAALRQLIKLRMRNGMRAKFDTSLVQFLNFAPYHAIHAKKLHALCADVCSGEEDRCSQPVLPQDRKRIGVEIAETIVESNHNMLSSGTTQHFRCDITHAKRAVTIPGKPAYLLLKVFGGRAQLVIRMAF